MCMHSYSFRWIQLLVDCNILQLIRHVISKESFCFGTKIEKTANDDIFTPYLITSIIKIR